MLQCTIMVGQFKINTTKIDIFKTSRQPIYMGSSQALSLIQVVSLILNNTSIGLIYERGED